MKKFENLGKSLSKNQQRKIMGGTFPACPTGETSYCCDYELSSGGSGSENVCSTSAYGAKVRLKEMHPDVHSSSCA